MSEVLLLNVHGDSSVMAALFMYGRDRRQAIRRNRVFRDRNHPLEKFDDVELYTKFRFRRQDITGLTDEIKDDIRCFFSFLR